MNKTVHHAPLYSNPDQKDILSIVSSYTKSAHFIKKYKTRRYKSLIIKLFDRIKSFKIGFKPAYHGRNLFLACLDSDVFIVSKINMTAVRLLARLSMVLPMVLFMLQKLDLIVRILIFLIVSNLWSVSSF